MPVARRFGSAALFLVVGVAIGGCSSSGDSYEDCILKGLDGAGKNDAAVAALTSACRAKFPAAVAEIVEKPETLELSLREIEQLTGRAGPDGAGEYSATLYNGNQDIRVIGITFGVVTEEDGKTEVRQYRVPVSILPLASARVSFPFLSGGPTADYNWTITAATGIRTEAVPVYAPDFFEGSASTSSVDPLDFFGPPPSAEEDPSSSPQ